MKVASLAAAACAVILAACAGLPSRPRPVVLPAAVPLDVSGQSGAAPWPEAKWWRRYDDETLDRLIQLALEFSPTLETAHARFDSARESVRLAGAAAGANVALAGDAQRQRLSDNGLFPPQLLGFHWYNQTDLGLQASYTFDWWGKQHAAIAGALNEARAAQAERSAAVLVLTGSIADAYFAWQSDQNRLVVAREMQGAMERERTIAEARVHAELDAADSLHRSDAALAAAREQIARLEGSAQLRIVALAALVGRPTSELPRLAVKPLPRVPTQLPDNVRLDLIARRPDITASRWRVEAAERNLDAARADFYPDISISALAGLSSIDLGRLIEYGSRVPQIGAAIHLPIFDAGRLNARYEANRVLIRAAVADYDHALIEAARDVATAFATRQQVVAQQAERLIAVDAANRLRSSAAARVRQGLGDARAVLAAEEAWMDQRDALMLLDAAAVSADIGLQRALGGGYAAPPELAQSAINSSKALP